MELATLRDAIEQRDADSMMALYADDAEVRVVDRNNPPSRPMILHGRSEIDGFTRDVMGREMTHRVEQPVVGDQRIAFNEACEYPDGVRVLSSNVLDLRDGKIAAHTVVQAWDE
jgi:ketosteroid isomerase-like protein